MTYKRLLLISTLSALGLIKPLPPWKASHLAVVARLETRAGASGAS